MKDDRLIQWNAFAICDTFKTYWLMGKLIKKALEGRNNLQGVKISETASLPQDGS